MAGEVVAVFEAYFESDLGDVHVASSQSFSRSVQPSLDQIGYRRVSHRRLKRPDEAAFGHVSHL